MAKGSRKQTEKERRKQKQKLDQKWLSKKQTVKLKIKHNREAKTRLEKIESR